jgi:putative sensor protein
VVQLAEVDEGHDAAVLAQGTLAVNGVLVGNLRVAACGIQVDRHPRDPAGAGCVVGADEPEDLPAGMREPAQKPGGEQLLWCGVPIAVPYLPPPAGEGSHTGLWRRYAWLLGDRATWRDLLWMVADCAVGWVLTLAPATLLAWGLFGVIMPAVWHPIVAGGGSSWYAFIHVTALCRPGCWPRAPRFQLEHRVQQLARTRSVAVRAGPDRGLGFPHRTAR